MCATSKKANAPKLQLTTPVQYIKGVGPRIGSILQQNGFMTVGDLLHFYPRTYQDRSTVKKISELQIDQPALVKGRITSFRYIPIRKLKRPMLEAVLTDESGRMSLKWFHYQKGFFESKFKSNPEIFAYGNIKRYGTFFEIVHPEMEFLTSDAENDEDETTETKSSDGSGILPIYVEHEGLNQRLLRKIVNLAIEATLDQLEDEIPSHVLNEHKLIPIQSAIRSIHNPAADSKDKTKLLLDFQTPEQRRLIFDDFFKFELVVGLRRMNLRIEETTSFPVEPGIQLLTELEKHLPYKLTGDQIQSIHKIFEDLQSTKPMNRLLQGDVGCGKTLVALTSCLPVFAAQAQAALLVPTEILAQQHFKNAIQAYQNLILPKQKRAPIVELLVGSTPKAKREDLLSRLRLGEIDLLIGTHALLEDPVVFKKLGLVLIDEQHRFGVDQRMLLRNKGKNPHSLSLTATPIPRTLALTAFGDLDVSTIKEMPKGRAPIHTKILRIDQKDNYYTKAIDELKKGRQVYVIYPLVDESEKIDLSNAIAGAEELANGPFSEFKVGLLHGKMKAQEKDAVMDQFKQGKVQILVSTTVIEVGVDVPNASIMVIENAERFGLSQLHQLRGRIGRGQHESWCFLIPGKAGSNDFAFERLKAMEETRDGFKLAELDLKIRGPGEFLGTRQSGELSFPYADLIRDQDVLIEARQAAFAVLKNDPQLAKPEHLVLKKYMEKKGLIQQARFETA